MSQKIIHILSISFLFFAFVSCANHGVRCAGKTPKYKHKTYRVKKVKRTNRAVAYRSSGSSSSSSPSSTQGTSAGSSSNSLPDTTQTVAKADTTTVIETKQTTSASNQTIPDLKTSGPPIEDEVIEFRGQDIVISEENGFAFDENIEFIDLSDLFSDRNAALASLEDLSDLLQQDPSLQVTVIGNTATESPNGEKLYGDQPAVLRQEAILNADTVQIRDVMIARAKRVYNLLIQEGVSPNQLEYTTGSHRQWAEKRVVSFILRRKD